MKHANKSQHDRRYYEKHHEEVRAQQVWTRLKVRYGITQAEYEAKSDEQGHVCAICGGTCKTDQRLCVDHNHATGEVRGLLCKSCNFKLGVLENEDWRVKAEAYLAYWIRDV